MPRPRAHVEPCSTQSCPYAATGEGSRPLPRHPRPQLLFPPPTADLPAPGLPTSRRGRFMAPCSLLAAKGCMESGLGEGQLHCGLQGPLAGSSSAG